MHIDIQLEYYDSPYCKTVHICNICPPTLPSLLSKVSVE